jgi:transcriptional regulator with XRE-family HTH domain
MRRTNEQDMSSARHVGEIIRRARKQLELTEEFCAQKCGLSPAHYYDLEAYGDEFAMNMSLGTARRICNLLRLDLLDLTATFANVQIARRASVDDAHFYSRHDLVLNTRLKKKLSEDDLANAIGYDTVTIRLLEQTPDFIESLPIDVVVDVAKALDLDPGSLICRWP